MARPQEEIQELLLMANQLNGALDKLGAVSQVKIGNKVANADSYAEGVINTLLWLEDDAPDSHTPAPLSGWTLLHILEALVDNNPQ